MECLNLILEFADFAFIHVSRSYLSVITVGEM